MGPFHVCRRERRDYMALDNATVERELQDQKPEWLRDEIDTYMKMYVMLVVDGSQTEPGEGDLGASRERVVRVHP